MIDRVARCDWICGFLHKQHPTPRWLFSTLSLLPSFRFLSRYTAPFFLFCEVACILSSLPHPRSLHC
ncbi:hypothetical protein ABKN59_008953 [Abortiporus biennis]